jgi:hypothetical protein
LLLCVDVVTKPFCSFKAVCTSASCSEKSSATNKQRLCKTCAVGDKKGQGKSSSGLISLSFPFVDLSSRGEF